MIVQEISHYFMIDEIYHQLTIGAEEIRLDKPIKSEIDFDNDYHRGNSYEHTFYSHIRIKKIDDKLLAFCLGETNAKKDIVVIELLNSINKKYMQYELENRLKNNYHFKKSLIHYDGRTVNPKNYNINSLQQKITNTKPLITQLRELDLQVKKYNLSRRLEQAELLNDNSDSFDYHLIFDEDKYQEFFNPITFNDDELLVKSDESTDLIKSKKKIKNLYLYNNERRDETKLRAFPKEIFKHPELEFLNIEKNLIQEIPNDIGQLTNLTELIIGYNQLRDLPDSISNLKKLKTLDISFNNISSLNDKISGLESLKQLNLTHNNLLIISDSVVELIINNECTIKNNYCLFVDNALSMNYCIIDQKIQHIKETNLDPDLINKKRLEKININITLDEYKANQEKLKLLINSYPHHYTTLDLIKEKNPVLNRIFNELTIQVPLNDNNNLLL